MLSVPTSMFVSSLDEIKSTEFSTSVAHIGIFGLFMSHISQTNKTFRII